MRILIVNHRYFVASGPERYLFGLTPLLQQAGHEVAPFSIRYAQNVPTEWSTYFADPIAGEDEILFEHHTWTPGSFSRAIKRVVYDRAVHRQLSSLVADFKPDVAYVLKYRRKLSPAVLVALAEAGTPIVVRLSDYGMVCPEEHMVRNDEPCDECAGGSLWPSVRHRCVHGSLGPSVVNLVGTTFHRRRGYYSLIDTFVSPSRFLREKLLRSGVEEERAVCLPTFIQPMDQRPAGGRDVISYVGRMQHKKGVDLLVDAFAELTRNGDFSDLRLIMAGDQGTADARLLRERVQRLGIPGVEFVGFVQHDEVLRILDRSVFSVVPSLSYENLPNALLESWSRGVPVVASDVGSLTETMGGTGAGLLFERGSVSDLAAKMRSLLEHPAEAEKMGQRGHELIVTRYDPQVHVDALLDILAEAVAQRGGADGD